MGALVTSNISPEPHERSRTPAGARLQYTLRDVGPSYLLRNSVPRGRLCFASRHRALVLKNVAAQGRQSLCSQTASHQHSSRDFNRVLFSLSADTPGLRRPWAVSSPSGAVGADPLKASPIAWPDRRCQESIPQEYSLHQNCEIQRCFIIHSPP